MPYKDKDKRRAAQRARYAWRMSARGTTGVPIWTPPAMLVAMNKWLSCATCLPQAAVGFFTVPEAARLLGLTRQGIYWRIHKGRLLALKLGGRSSRHELYRISPDQIHLALLVGKGYLWENGYYTIQSASETVRPAHKTRVLPAAMFGEGLCNCGCGESLESKAERARFYSDACRARAFHARR